jgi:hypothetical protein
LSNPSVCLNGSTDSLGDPSVSLSNS